MQDTTDTEFVPALRLELQDLESRLGTIRITVVVPQREYALRRCGALLPEPLRGFICHLISAGAQDDAHQFLILKALIEGFETANLRHDLRGDAGGWGLWE